MVRSPGMSRVSTILTILLFSFASAAASVSMAAPGSSALDSLTLKKIERSATIMVDSKSGNYCTVFPVSEDGYLLTAVHCLKTCLEDVNPKPNSDFFCANQTIPSLNVKGVKVVAIGNALTSKEQSNRFGDYAVLKVETKKSLSCLAISDKSTKAGEDLWAMGFPVSKSLRTKSQLSASPGKLYESPVESRYYKAQNDQAERDLISKQYARDAGVMYSNAHHMPGQSGGPVVNKEGRVIGIISGFTVTQSGRREIHELVAGSTEKILKDIPLRLSSLLIEKSRDCQARL